LDRHAAVPRLHGYRLRIGMPGRLHLSYEGGDKENFPNQLFINPDECIDCGACEPECPWQAIFEEAAVPEPFKDDITLNYKTIDQSSEFVVQKHEPKEAPTPEQVEANKAKWELAP